VKVMTGLAGGCLTRSSAVTKTPNATMNAAAMISRDPLFTRALTFSDGHKVRPV
jgi:hypothetical protein